MGEFIRQTRALLLTAAAVTAALLPSGCSKALTLEPARVTYGALTDERDGKKYKTVVIGGKTWMAENLNYHPESGVSWCYADDSSFCGKYGRLYDWETAAAACPAGYHLPSREEWDILARAAGGGMLPGVARFDVDRRVAGGALKAKSGWRDPLGRSGGGADSYGFSALPGGYRDFYDSAFAAASTDGYWWTAADVGDMFAYSRNMYYGNDYLSESYLRTGSGLSVRCLQDERKYRATVSSVGAAAKGGGDYGLGDCTVSSGGAGGGGDYAPGEAVTVTAGAAPGRQFKAWSTSPGGATVIEADGATMTFLMPAADITLTAVFDTIAVKPGALADARDGKTYKTVTIGDKTWMAENLNYHTPSGSWCYGDDVSNCDKYGRLYDWNTAEAVCPAGWHLPARREWNYLEEIAGGNSIAGKMLKSKKGWMRGKYRAIPGNGADAYGFSALPGGGAYNGGQFDQKGKSGFWWATAKGDGADADPRKRDEKCTFHRIQIYFGVDRPYWHCHGGDRGFGASVRCVQDGTAAEEEEAEKELNRRTAKFEAEKKEAARRKIEKNITCFADPRDGRTYRAVKIARRTWMAENLNYRASSGSWCYGGDTANCAKYGRLYDWETAKKACPPGWYLPSYWEWTSMLDLTANTACLYTPGYWSGGRLRAKSVRPYKADSGVRADRRDNADAYGFSALPSGYYDIDRVYDVWRRPPYENETAGSFREADSSAYWWSSSYKYKYGADRARYFNMEFDDFSIHENTESGASAMSVRCVLGGGGRADSMRFAKEQKQMKRESAERKKREERREYEKKQAEERAKLPVENTSTYFTDPRDGQTYRAVTIIGKKWMAQNLNYKADSSWCYGGADSNCVKYGRLYNWSAAQTACPAGYHLPSIEEWADLGLGMELEWYARKELHFVRGDDDRDSYWYNVGDALKAKSGWNDHNGKSGGADDYGFSLLPGGSHVYGGKYGPDFHDAGSDGYWWTDVEKDDGYSSYWRIGVDGYLSAYRGGGSTAHSVRCAADAP